MTGAELDTLKVAKITKLGNIVIEVEAETPEEEAERVEINWRDVGQIFSNLQVGTNVTITSPLKSNYKLSSRGVQLIGSGFCLTKKEAKDIESNVVHPYLNGRDLLQVSRNTLVIDLFGLTEDETIKNYPKAYQWLYDRVKPEREQNNRISYRKNWWIFGEPRANLRPALKTIERYIATIETAKHRVFIFLKSDVIPDNMLIAIALNEAYFLGTLSSSIHTIWALAAGGDLGGNTPRYNKTRCFDPFPFPDPTPEQKTKNP